MIREIKYKLSTLLAHSMENMAQRASKNKKNWLDKIITQVVARMLRTKKNKVDFMDDDLIASEPGFDIEELEAYEKGQ